MQSRLRWERGACHDFQSLTLICRIDVIGQVRQAGLDSQALAALGAAGVQNGTAATGFHAHAETVGTLATGNGRLVSTFHVRSTKNKGVRGLSFAQSIYARK